MLKSKFPLHVTYSSWKIFLRELNYIPWHIVFLIVLLGAVGCVTLYSAGGGNWSPWAYKQLIRIGLGFVLMIGLAFVPLPTVYRWSYLLFFLSVFCLIVVELKGLTGMGARRWINLGVMQLQPSEFVKLTLMLAIARYCHNLTAREAQHGLTFIVPLCFILLPFLLIVRQPDLGTALIILMVGGALIIVSGVHKIYLIIGSVGLACIGPIVWPFLHHYQRKRVLTFLNPESDPLGAGYHVIQSKIALGSGGFFGKGYMKGSQSYLNFLPEKQTDFIFTMIGEEWGFVGAISLILVYISIIFYGYKVSWYAYNQFSRLVAFGTTTSLFLYVFINIAMVMGLLPVVGLPLPLMSYGGTSVVVLMSSFGLLFACDMQSKMRMINNSL